MKQGRHSWAVRAFAPSGAPIALWGVIGELGKLADDAGGVELTPARIAGAALFLGQDGEQFKAQVHQLVNLRWLAPLQVTPQGLRTHLRSPR